MLRRLLVLAVMLTLCASAAFAQRSRVIIRPSHRVRAVSPRTVVVRPFDRRVVAVRNRGAAVIVGAPCGTSFVTSPFFFTSPRFVTVPRYVYVPYSPVTTWETGNGSDVQAGALRVKRVDAQHVHLRWTGPSRDVDYIEFFTANAQRTRRVSEQVVTQPPFEATLFFDAMPATVGVTVVYNDGVKRTYSTLWNTVPSRR